MALIHLPPAAVLAAPQLVSTLYGVKADAALDLLLVHRAAMFLAIAVLAMSAAFVPELRRAASVTLGISILAFLLLYARAAFPAGPLRTIACVDAIALIPLLQVSVSAWRH